MGLGSVNEKNGLYLSIAGGYIWNRKADKNDPDYAEQEFTRADKTTGVRAGARYADLTGYVIKVEFKTHQQYGESINITVESGGERYILSISTNNRYSQSFMKALLNMDLTKPLFIKPYDFIGSDKKRANGISFKQDGEKLELKVEVGSEFVKDKDWFKNANKKAIKRYFEDLNDWFVAEVEELVIPKLESLPKDDESTNKPKQDTKQEVKDAPETKEKTEEPKRLSPIKMKKFLKEYIAENYDDGKELPKLSKNELANWYNLALAEEELPFEEDTDETDTDGEVSDCDLDSQLDALMG